jgi:hypothetical protein
MTAQFHQQSLLKTKLTQFHNQRPSQNKADSISPAKAPQTKADSITPAKPSQNKAHSITVGGTFPATPFAIPPPTKPVQQDEKPKYSTQPDPNL